MGHEHQHHFPESLEAREIRDTAHSVAKWVCQKFSEGQFRKIQQHRARRPRKATADVIARIKEANS